MEQKIPVIAVVGATASGKSTLAMQLAKHFNSEIISGDSMQIYKKMDIGTAKPTLSERAEVPHHLIDIAEIEEPFSVADFVQLAGESIRDITSRGKVPIIAGGTGLYIQMLLSGTSLTHVNSDPVLRGQLWQRSQEDLFAYLQKIDPVAAETIHPNNKKRVIRAIEIYETTGKTKTALDRESLLNPSPYDAKIIYLSYEDRDELYARINRRVDEMFDAGLENEVRPLFDQGLESTKTASQAIGYKEFFPYFRGKCSLDDVRSAICQSSRNYAKRQITFFGRQYADKALPVTPDILEKALEHIDI